MGRLRDDGQIILRLSVFQYLTGLMVLQEWTYLLYGFTKMNIDILSNNT